MRAGRKNQRIQIQQLVSSRSATGNETTAWAAYKNVYAEVTYDTGGEHYASNEIISDAVVKFKIDFIRGLSPKNYRIRYKNLIYDIEFISEVGRNEALQIVAKAQPVTGVAPAPGAQPLATPSAVGNLVASVFGRIGAVVAAAGDYTTDLVSEASNLYFTAQRVLDTALTGFTPGAGTVDENDTVLTALQKLAAGTGGGGSVDSVNGQTGTVVLTKSDVGLGSVDNTADTAKPVSTLQAAADAVVLASAIQRSNHTGSQLASTISDFNTAADARITAQKGAVNGVASLNGSGKIPDSQLPAIAITSTYVVNSQAAQLALVAEEGDVAVRTDQSKSYIHNGGTSGTMADWQELKSPTDLVLSVNGQIGSVVIPVTTSGVAEIDFGGVPTTEAILNIIGQSDITADSQPYARITARTTVDNDAEAHIQAAAKIRLVCSAPTAGVGFTITAFCDYGFVTGSFKIDWGWL